MKEMPEIPNGPSAKEYPLEMDREQDGWKGKHCRDGAWD